MESEKVKEIKECLEEFKDDRIGYYTNGIDRLMLTKEDVLTYINELEKENAKLLDSVEMVQNNRCTTKCELTEKQLKQFAERLKEKIDEKKHFLVAVSSVHKHIDEILKELNGE